MKALIVKADVRRSLFFDRFTSILFSTPPTKVEHECEDVRKLNTGPGAPSDLSGGGVQ